MVNEDKPYELLESGIIGEFPYAIIRSKESLWFGKWLCGYLGVPPSHPWYGSKIDIDAIPDINYSNNSEDYPMKLPTEVWWLGFDIAHYHDIENKLTNDRDYCFHKIELLAKAAAEAIR